MLTDLRFALRQLLKSPGFTLLAVITLTLGIGLNTAIFSLINDLFLRGLPFKEPGRLVHIYSGEKTAEGAGLAALRAALLNFIAKARRFSTASPPTMVTAVTLTGLGDPVQIGAFRVTANYFDVLGVQPIRGRTFLPNEEEGADVAIVSEKFWHRRLGGDPNVLGRSITLDGVAHTIVGVIPNMPVPWVGPNGNEVWTTKPFVIPGFSHERMMRGTAFLRTIGRLKPGLTIEQAAPRLPALEQSYRTQNPGKIDADLKTTIVDAAGRCDRRSCARRSPRFSRRSSFVLLIACSNVANLLLVRFSGRRREIALRMALGASRASVLRLFVLESLLVSVLAGVVGALLAWQLIPLVPKITANFLPLDATAVQRLAACARVYLRAFAPHRAGDGNLSGLASFARRSGRWLEGRWPRQRAAACGNNVSAGFWSARRSRSRSLCSPARLCSSPVSLG